MERPPGNEKWKGPYLKNAASLTDPWGNPYGYRFPGDNAQYDLYSTGADGQEGGEDDDKDITNW